MNHYQKLTFHLLGDFLNSALVLLGQSLRKSLIGQKLNFANHPYLCKGLYKRIYSAIGYLTPAEKIAELKKWPEVCLIKLAHYNAECR